MIGVSGAASADLPADPRAARTARALVREHLTDWGLGDLVDTVQLLITELVTNALLHTGAGASASLAREGQGVRVTVADTSPVLPRMRAATSTATTGRGCQLVSALSDDWGAHAQDAGKAVWFVVTRPAGDA